MAIKLLSTAITVKEGVNLTADVVLMRSGDLSGITTVTVTPLADTADCKRFSSYRENIFILNRLFLQLDLILSPLSSRSHFLLEQRWPLQKFLL